MGGLTIGEVAGLTGIRTSALRFYEESGVLPTVPRVNGQRRYDSRALRMIEVLAFAQRAGFTLAEIRILFNGPTPPLGARWRALAQAKLKELDHLVALAGQMRVAIESGLECGCMRIEDCVVGTGAAGTRTLAEACAGKPR
jgi:MerR family redox-sensitive transcriptional activator SoxR